MRQRFGKIIVALILTMLYSVSYAQQHSETKLSNPVLKQRSRSFDSEITSGTYKSLLPSALPKFSQQATGRPLHPISEDYFTKNFGFFCRKEWQFQKRTTVPLRFRLGSLEYCDYLEVKPNSYRSNFGNYPLHINP